MGQKHDALKRWLDKLEDSAPFRILKLAGMLSFVMAVGLWFYEADARRQARHNEAWRLIYIAAGNPGDGGRKVALRILNEDGVSLAGAPLSGASLRRIELAEANLTRANLNHADLSYASLTGAVLLKANLKKTKLFKADLSRAILRQADLTGADLVCTDFTDADLTGAIWTAAEFCKTTMPNGRIEDRDCVKTGLGQKPCPP